MPTYSKAGGASLSSTSAPFNGAEKFTEPLYTPGGVKVIDTRICPSTHLITSLGAHASFRLRNTFDSATSYAAAAWRSMAFAMVEAHFIDDAIASVPGGLLTRLAKRSSASPLP